MLVASRRNGGRSMYRCMGEGETEGLRANTTACHRTNITSRFIGPCKSWTDARFGITKFVTPKTHVFRHPEF